MCFDSKEERAHRTCTYFTQLHCIMEFKLQYAMSVRRDATDKCCPHVVFHKTEGTLQQKTYPITYLLTGTSC
jgi:hypothetical protein